MSRLFTRPVSSLSSSSGSSHGKTLPFKTTNDSLRDVLMHGNLDIWIHEAWSLPNMHAVVSRLSMLSSSSSKNNTSDPYVTVVVAGAVVARTYVIDDCENRVWEQYFNVPVAHRAQEIHFMVKDNDVVGSELIGAVGVSAESLLTGKRVERVFPIVSNISCPPGASLRLSVQYTPVERIALYRPVDTSNSDFLAVQGTYFPLRKGGKVTLYQDADCCGDLPGIELRLDVQYERSRCWCDMVDAINGARRLVYITGWSVYHNVKLIRGGPGGGTLGDLLKAKSQEPIDGCPRQPWHDLHSKVEGPAAYDILQNFEERWRKASKPRGLRKLTSHDDSLLFIDQISDIVPMSHSTCLSENDLESWNVQIFRSIDSNSVEGFPEDPKKATKKNILIDKSIHTAYVKAIHSAQHFIYIENQYFIGSSYNWCSARGRGANNLIPMEIALKIVSKIKANERFCAYIVIPMWPEGDPKGIWMQSILFSQYKTMQMMYEMIYEALKESELENKYEPQDYLNFFCLGNREAPDGNLSSL